MTQQKSEKRATTIGVRSYEWWRDNCQGDSGKIEASRRKFDPAVRAKLRRCRSNTDAAMIPAAVSLAIRLQALRSDVRVYDPSVDAVLGLARVLSFVTEDTPERPMRAAGWQQFPGENSKSQSPENQPRLADARFKRLLGVKAGEEQVIAFTRLVRLLGGSVNVAELSRDFLHWRRDETRRRWAFDYYAASFAAPKSDDTSNPEDNV
jgi:CRISPR type I-E-associated protein CasB/Cse2